MNTDTNFDRIEAYLFDQFSPAEKQAFEREMQDNPGLAARVEQHRLEHRAMELLLQQEMRDNLAAWKADQENTETASEGVARKVPIGLNRRLILRIAAAASVLLVIGFFSRDFFSGTDNAGLASAYFEESGVAVRSGASDALPEALTPMLDRMAEKDYRGALAAAPTGTSGDLREKTLLLQGECYFYLRDYDNAAAAFNTLLSSSPSPSAQEQAEWLLLLTYVAEGKHPQEAERLFGRILGDKGHGYREDAEELRSKVD